MRQHILPFLKRNRIARIDYVILSNHTRKRSEGTFALLSSIPVGCLMDSGHVTPYYGQERLLEVLEQKKAVYRILRSQETISLDRVLITVLNPPAAFHKGLQGPEMDVKNNSLVLKVRYKGQALLLCSDILRGSIAYLVSVHAKELFSNVINPPDFNSGNYYIAPLFETARASVCLVNKTFSPWEEKDLGFYGHALKVFRMKGLFTQETGAVRLTLNKKIRISTSRL
jgi:hypothetical protein